MCVCLCMSVCDVCVNIMCVLCMNVVCECNLCAVCDVCEFQSTLDNIRPILKTAQQLGG